MKLFENYNSQAVLLNNFIFEFKNRLLTSHYPQTTFNLSNFKEKEIKDKQKIEKEINFYNKEAILWQEKQLYAQKN